MGASKRRIALVRAVGALALAAGVLAFGAPRAQATPAFLYVQASLGVDTGNCQTATSPCQTITYALSQAPPGSFIKLADGFYPEQLTISQSVTITGDGIRTVIEPTSLPLSAPDPDSATPQDYIIGVTPGTGGVYLKNIAVSGAGVSSSFTSCAANLVGVYYHDAYGGIGSVQVFGTVLPPAQAACAEGTGVFVASDPGRTSNLTVSYSSVKQYQLSGITCDDPGTTCNVLQSSVQGLGASDQVPPNGIVMHGASGSITTTGVTGNSYAAGGAFNQGHGLYLLNAGQLLVKQNRLWSNDVDLYAGEVPSLGLVPPVTGTWVITRNGASSATDYTGGPHSDGYGDGIVIDSTTAPVQVNKNIAKDDVANGIALLGTTQATVSANTAVLDYNGIYVGGPGRAVSVSTANRVVLNNARANYNDGIATDLNSRESGNDIEANHSQSNLGWQLVDLSTGTKTAGTANTWIVNRCHHGRTGIPAGICA